MITNRHQLPQVFVDVHGPRQPRPEHYTVRCSSLIKPPQLHRLELDHWDELEGDAGDMAHALFGTAFHKYMEGVRPDDDAHVELPLEASMNEWTVTGTVDRIQGTTLIDYKTCTSWKIRYADFGDWEAQLNVYAWLAGQNGMDVERLEIWAYNRVWQERNDSDISPCPISVIRLPLWDDPEAWIAQRLAKLIDPPPCTDEERWARGGNVAVMKKGRKTALRLFDTVDQADDYIDSQLRSGATEDMYVQERPAQYMRCERYCPVSMWCEQWNG